MEDRDRAPSPEARSEMHRIADVLQSTCARLKRFQPPSPLAGIELNDEALELRLEVRDGSVDVTIPYFREHAQEVMECVTSCLDAVKAAAHYTAWDPQLGRVVATADLNEMVAQYKGTRPWWKLW